VISEARKGKKGKKAQNFLTTCVLYLLIVDTKNDRFHCDSKQKQQYECRKQYFVGKGGARPPSPHRYYPMPEKWILVLYE
jgi:hypothetical protein